MCFVLNHSVCVVCYSSYRKPRQEQGSGCMLVDKDGMVKVPWMWQGGGLCEDTASAALCPLCSPPLPATFVNYPCHARPFPQACGRLLIGARHPPLVSVLEIHKITSFRAKGLITKLLISELLPVSWVTLKCPSVLLFQSVFLALVSNDSANGTVLPPAPVSLWLPGSLGSLHPLALPCFSPSRRFSKALVQMAAASLPAECWHLGPFLVPSGALPSPLAVETSQVSSLPCETCFWLEKAVCPWALQRLHTFAVVVPCLGR